MRRTSARFFARASGPSAAHTPRTVTVGDVEVPFEPLFEALVQGEEILHLSTGEWFRLDHPVLAELLCSNRPGFGASVRRHAMASTYAPGEADGKPVAAVLIRVIGQGKGSTPGQDRMTPQGSLPGRR